MGYEQTWQVSKWGSARSVFTEHSGTMPFMAITFAGDAQNPDRVMGTGHLR